MPVPQFLHRWKYFIQEFSEHLVILYLLSLGSCQEDVSLLFKEQPGLCGLRICNHSLWGSKSLTWKLGAQLTFELFPKWFLCAARVSEHTPLEVCECARGPEDHRVRSDPGTTWPQEAWAEPHQEDMAFFPYPCAHLFTVTLCCCWIWC